MGLASVRIRNWRSFEDSGDVHLGPINVFVGRNNEGKSTLLRAIYAMQDGVDVRDADVRLGATMAETRIVPSDRSEPWLPTSPDAPGLWLEYRFVRGDPNTRTGLYYRWNTDSDPGGGEQKGVRVTNVEPKNLFYLHLSLRRVRYYQTGNMTAEQAATVSQDLANLVSKVLRIASPIHPMHTQYKAACEGVLGFVVGHFADNNGQRIGVSGGGDNNIALEEMGSGVASMLGMIVDLCVAEGKIIVIEEPENDLHPDALKALCRLILEKSDKNQFLISTHSHIVLQELGAHRTSRIFEVVADTTTQPWTSRVQLLQSTEDRIGAMRDMGYALHDFALYDGWLFLEESSAEALILGYLIPWFVPSLRVLRTMAGQGVESVKPMFAEFKRHFMFAHLETVYNGRAWVLVDGDPIGKEVVSKLQEDFSGAWASDHFRHLEKPSIEYYYPAEFASRYAEMLATLPKQDLRAAKKQLLQDLRRRLDENPTAGKALLEESAGELISFLKEIAAVLAPDAPQIAPVVESADNTSTDH